MEYIVIPLKTELKNYGCFTQTLKLFFTFVDFKEVRVYNKILS